MPTRVAVRDDELARPGPDAVLGDPGAECTAAQHEHGLSDSHWAGLPDIPPGAICRRFSCTYAQARGACASSPELCPASAGSQAGGSASRFARASVRMPGMAASVAIELPHVQMRVPPVGSGESSHRRADDHVQRRRRVRADRGELVRHPDLGELIQQLGAADLLSGKRGHSSSAKFSGNSKLSGSCRILTAPRKAAPRGRSPHQTTPISGGRARPGCRCSTQPGAATHHVCPPGVPADHDRAHRLEIAGQIRVDDHAVGVIEQVVCQRGMQRLARSTRRPAAARRYQAASRAMTPNIPSAGFQSESEWYRQIWWPPQHVREPREPLVPDPDRRPGEGEAAGDQQR